MASDDKKVKVDEIDDEMMMMAHIALTEAPDEENETKHDRTTSIIYDDDDDKNPGSLYINQLKLDQDIINALKHWMKLNNYDENINLFNDFDFNKGINILSSIEEYFTHDGKYFTNAVRIRKPIQTINKGIRKLNNILWYGLHHKDATHEEKYNDQIKCIYFEKFVKWTKDEWIEDIKKENECKLYKLVKDKLNVDLRFYNILSDTYINYDREPLYSQEAVFGTDYNDYLNAKARSGRYDFDKPYQNLVKKKSKIIINMGEKRDDINKVK
eukprot:545366_1